jgi:alkylation response protein AidB-like acyl-CoA dehydrogenase
VPLRQPGIELRPMRDLVGAEHFCEVFFDGARTGADLIVGAPGDGWKIAMATLGFERGTSFMGQLVRYGGELQRLIDLSRKLERLGDPHVRQNLASLKIGFELMRYGLYRTVTSVLRDGRPGPEASLGKLQWSQWHQQLGEAAAMIVGPAMVAGEPGPEIDEIRRNFLFSRAHTIYAGTSQVQRNIIGERVLGLPKEREDTAPPP